MKTKTLFFLSLLLLFSCKKESDKQSTSIPEPKGEYILGRFGNDTFIFTNPNYIYGNPNTPDTISNVAFSYGEIYMTRNDLIFPTRGISFYLGNAWIDSLQLNKKLPYAELVLYNYLCQVDTTFGKHDSCNYHGSTFDNDYLDVMITSKNNDTLTGNFRGNIKTGSGITMPVSDGKFKIRLIRKKV